MNINQQAQGKPYSLQEQGNKCDECSRLVSAGEEELRYIRISYVEVSKRLFCRIWDMFQ